MSAIGADQTLSPCQTLHIVMGSSSATYFSQMESPRLETKRIRGSARALTNTKQMPPATVQEYEWMKNV